MSEYKITMMNPNMAIDEQHQQQLVNVGQTQNPGVFSPHQNPTPPTQTQSTNLQEDSNPLHLVQSQIASLANEIKQRDVHSAQQRAQQSAEITQHVAQQLNQQLHQELAQQQTMLTQAISDLTNRFSNLTNSPGGNVGGIPVVPQPGVTRGTGWLLTNKTGKERDVFIAGFPKFNKKEMDFNSYQDRVERWCKIKEVDRQARENGEMLKDLLYYGITNSPGCQRVLNARPEMYLQNSYSEYETILREKFDPAPESSEYTNAYKARRQRANEHVRDYLEEKWWLYNMSNPHHDPRDFAKVREEILYGLLNSTVYERAVETPAENWAELYRIIVTLTHGEQLKQRQGRSSGNVDGIGMINWKGIEDMGISNKFKPSVNQVGFEEYEMDGTVSQFQMQGRGQSRGQFSNRRPFRGRGRGQGRGGKPRGKCWDCGSLEHFRNSPKCNSNGAGKFLPTQPIQRRSNGVTFNNSVSQLQNDEEIPVLLDEQSNAFLEMTQPPNTPK